MGAAGGAREGVRERGGCGVGGSKKGGTLTPSDRVTEWSCYTLEVRPSSEGFGKAFKLLSTLRRPGLRRPRVLPREVRDPNRLLPLRRIANLVHQAVSKFSEELTFSLGVLFEGEKCPLTEAASRFQGFALSLGPAQTPWTNLARKK